MSYFITSVPKSGTHLVATIVQDLTGSYPITVKKLAKRAVYPTFDPAQSLVGHFRAKTIRNNLTLAKLFNDRKVLLLVRDPRAICNSMLHHLMTSSNKYHAEGREMIQGLPLNEQLIKISKGLFAKDGTEIVADLDRMCTGFDEIREVVPHSVRLRYEDFFDAKVVSERLPEIFGIEAARAEQCVERALATDSRTKRVGNPDNWRSAWDEDVTRHFNSTFGSLIEKLGYQI
jgi:hypothetical protein